jgi:hypothetical protein
MIEGMIEGIEKKIKSLDDRLKILEGYVWEADIKGNFKSENTMTKIIEKLKEERALLECQLQTLGIAV